MASKQKGMGKEGSAREERMESAGERMAENRAGMAYRNKMKPKAVVTIVAKPKGRSRGR